MPTRTCITCATSKDMARLSGGWKEHAGRTYCPDCWNKAYRRTAATFAINEVRNPDEADKTVRANGVERNPHPGGALAPWADWCRDAHGCWRATTDLANWMANELLKPDHIRCPSDSRMPAMPKAYLYPQAVKLTSLAPHVVASMEQAVQARYRGHRLDVWRAEASPLRFRYPYPLPIHQQNWEPWFTCDDPDGEACVTTYVHRVEEVGKQGETKLVPARRVLVLRSGSEFRRQIAVFRQLVNGEAVRCEAALLARPATSSAHRPVAGERAAGGGRRKSLRHLFKIVAWVPRRERQPGESELILRTDPECMLVAEMFGREQWRVHAEHVRRWVARHCRYLQAMSDDTKHEIRTGGRHRKQLNETRELRCQKHADRINTFCHQLTAQCVAFAVRMKAEAVSYDDTLCGYLPSFCWHKVRCMLETKLDAVGIRYQHEGSEAESDDVAA